MLHLTQGSAVGTVPGDTALRTMVGSNIEIISRFLISGIIYDHPLFPDRTQKILGIPNRWFGAVAYAAFCVFVECLRNMGGHLVWEYPWWNRSLGGVWLIFFFGDVHFQVAALLVIGMRTLRAKVITVASLYGIAIVANSVAMGVLGWRYWGNRPPIMPGPFESTFQYPQ